MIEIIPAVIPKTREDVEQIVSRYIDSSVKTIQIDLVDGEYAPPKTWPYNSTSQYQEYQLLKKEGFPGWQDIDIELDLMVANPLQDMTHFIDWGPARIILHADTILVDEYTIFLQEHISTRSFIDFGIAFSVQDKIEDYQAIFEHIDFVQCMGIDNIGYQGQVFDERVFTQIEKVKQFAPSLPISVDGGVNTQTALRLLEVGVTRLVSGSFLADSPTVEEGLKELVGDSFTSEM